jgi:hypothetical protein
MHIDEQIRRIETRLAKLEEETGPGGMSSETPKLQQAEVALDFAKGNKRRIELLEADVQKLVTLSKNNAQRITAMQKTIDVLREIVDCTKYTDARGTET